MLEVAEVWHLGVDWAANGHDREQGTRLLLQLLADAVLWLTGQVPGPAEDTLLHLVQPEAHYVREHGERLQIFLEITWGQELLRPEAVLSLVLSGEPDVEKGNKKQLDVFEPSHSKIVDQYGGN